MENQYSALGSWFEYLNDDCDYLKWSQYLIKRLSDNNAGANGFDIGCGNGYFTRALSKAGYDVMGGDISPQMLTVARNKAAEEMLPCTFVLMDVTRFKVLGKLDFAVAVNDCFNYVPSGKLLSTFKRIYSSLNAGGVFIFDISSSNKIRNILGNNMFGEDREDISYLWFNTQTPEGVIMDLTYFVKQEGGLYKRYEERHVQYAHEEEDVINLLKQVGFSVQTEGHLGGEKTERINFICTKN
jgi:SAM-dependent methyltransferase